MADTQTIAQSAPKTPAWDPAAPENAWYKWRAFWAVGLSLVTMVMSFSIIFLALPAIAEDFGITFKEASLLVIAQSLTISSLMVPLGKVADMIGRKKFHLIGMALFGGGAIACAFATSLTFLIITRVIMSIGSSMGQSVSTAITTSVFPASERGKALGSQTTAVAIGGAAGTVVSGVTLQFLPWQALFIFMAIPTAVAFFWGLYILKDERIGSFSGEKRPPYDWLGAALSAVATAIIILTITNPFALAWGSPIIIAGAFTGIATLIVFVWWQLKTPNPMVDLRLFKNKVFKYSIITRYLAFMRSSATLFVLPIYLVAFRGWPEILASGVMLMMAIGMGIGAQVFGRLSDRYGVRPFMMGGFFFLVLTGIALATLDDTSNVIYIAVVVLINGLAMGAWSAPNASATMGSVPQSAYGLVSAIINLTRNLGNVSGQAIITAIIAGVMIARGFNIPLGELEDTPEAGFAFMDGWKYAYLAATGVVALAFITSFLTKPGKNESQAT
ncbi:MAG: MFS transporter [Chloroflexi bacterium]|nr:MFS transporter [Chloroflexota bacterium]MYK61744.1 MFS transporter [Chloroflexota bacterium]